MMMMMMMIARNKGREMGWCTNQKQTTIQKRSNSISVTGDDDPAAQPAVPVPVPVPVP